MLLVYALIVTRSLWTRAVGNAHAARLLIIAQRNISKLIGRHTISLNVAGYKTGRNLHKVSHAVDALEAKRTPKRGKKQIKALRTSIECNVSVFLQAVFVLMVVVRI